MKKIKVIATVAVITAITVLAGCSKNKDNDSSVNPSTATGDVADAVDNSGDMPSATVLPSAGDDKEGSFTVGAGESSSDLNDGIGENKDDLEQDENGSTAGNVNQDDESAGKGTLSEDASESGNKVNGSQSASGNGNSSVSSGSNYGSGASDVIFSFAGSETAGSSQNGGTTATPTAAPTAAPTATPTEAAPTIKSYIILVDKKVDTLVSNKGTLVLWEIEHDDPEKGYPYITSRTSYSVELIDEWLREEGARDLFLSACCDINETYGTKLGGYVIGQEEKIVDVDFVTEDGNSYLLEDPSCGVGVYVRYSINETIGCVYSDGTKVYY